MCAVQKCFRVKTAQRKAKDVQEEMRRRMERGSDSGGEEEELRRLNSEDSFSRCWPGGDLQTPMMWIEGEKKW